MAALDPRIEVIRERFGLSKEDFWELPQKKGTWVAKHSALEVAAAKANIVFELPLVIETSTAEGIAVLAVTGHMGDRIEWSTGEASPKNNKNAYPWAMAEKRAKDRVILKLIGIHGLVYSEDEMSDVATVQPKAQARAPYAELQTEVDACTTTEELTMLWRSKPFQDAYAALPPDWREQLLDRFKEAKAEFSKADVNGGYVPPSFPGDMPKDTAAAVRYGNTP